jgi:hypothetical protein
VTDEEFLALAYEWSDPPPDGVRHTNPSDDGRVSCCGRRADALPRGDWTTAGTDRIARTGAEGRS